MLSTSRLLISLGISAIIYILFDYIKYKYHNNIINKINACVLQSIMMYFNDMDIEIEEVPKFNNFINMRLRDNKLEEYIKDMKVKHIDSKKVSVSYDFKRGEDTYQNISFDIRKNN
ncbi:hypothetical protein [Alkaliphilus sp. B6464]|uniref:hypothetical protein n=1 Tax=Alkaliphilus sp. B6464 TaxID=2731219 RepID=UPI001BA72EDC|nr:hypothetical protein [Alkaliphilus sp. B6464]QUH22145.1 hypothetical protein HYG84_19755 [Alkaliphilus sp. B6464]